MQAIQQKIADIHADADMASTYILLVDRDRVLLQQGFGIKSWDDPQRVDESSYYRLGSITKAFTGLALLKAQEQGCLTLDAPLRNGLEPLPYTNRWPDRPITLAMLMEHTAGWHDMSWDEFLYSKPGSLETALAYRPQSRITAWPPGMHSEYSNSGSGVAGLMLETACEHAYEDFLQRQILEPLGMESATSQYTASVRADLVQGYNRDGHEPIPYWHFIYPPGGAMNVRPVDMRHFLQLLLNRGRHDGKGLFSPEQMRRLETPTTTVAARAGLDFGYGLGVYASIKDGQVIYGHGGDADGYLTHFAYSHDSGRAYFAVITKFDHSVLDSMRDVLERWLVENLPARKPPPAVDLKEEQMQRLAGTYRPASVRFPEEGWQNARLELSIRDGSLGYQYDKRNWRALIPVTPEQFRRGGDPVATTAIVQTGDTIVLQGPMGNWLRRTSD